MSKKITRRNFLRQSALTSLAVGLTGAGSSLIVGCTRRAFDLIIRGGTVYDGENGLDPLKLGYGVGMRLKSRTGLVSMDYGLARGDSILSGKIHVSLGAVF